MISKFKLFSLVNLLIISNIMAAPFDRSNGSNSNDEQSSKVQNTTSSKSFNFDTSTLKGLEFFAGANIGNVKSNDSEDDLGTVTTTGFSVKVGKEIQLAEQFSITPSMQGSMNFWDKEDLIDSETQESPSVKTRDFGPSVKASYHIKTRGFKAKPFIELGYAWGTFGATYEGVELGQTYEGIYELNYTRLSLAVGIEAKLSNNLVPYVKYERSRANLSNQGTTEFKVNGDTVETGTESLEDNDAAFDRNLISMGIGYQF